MEEYVHQVVAHGLELVDEVVEPEGSHNQGSVRLVTAFNVHGCAPEVVPYQVCPRSLRPQVHVVSHGRGIVETEAAVQRVYVHHHGHEGADQLSSIAVEFPSSKRVTS